MAAMPFAQPASTTTDWRDRLVELHVLSEHGCADSLTSAEGWLAVDSAAHDAWHTVERACREVRDGHLA